MVHPIKSIYVFSGECLTRSAEQSHHELPTKYVSWAKVHHGITHRLATAKTEVGLWASCQIRKIAGSACAGNVFPTTAGGRS